MVCAKWPFLITKTQILRSLRMSSKVLRAIGKTKPFFYQPLRFEELGHYLPHWSVTAHTTGWSLWNSRACMTNTFSGSAKASEAEKEETGGPGHVTAAGPSLPSKNLDFGFKVEWVLLYCNILMGLGVGGERQMGAVPEGKVIALNAPRCSLRRNGKTQVLSKIT